MDNKALYKLTYGVFMLAVKDGDKVNGCITNTGIQVAGNPTRIAISVLNTNYTCELLKNSGVFALTLLDDSVTFETIKHFGMQSGRDVDKFADLKLPTDENDIPYLPYQSCAVLSCKVLQSVDLDTHTLFIAELTDAKVLSERDPLTYADYQTRIKPKPAKPVEEKKVKAWRCKICGYIYEGSELPADYRCPTCGHGPEDFEPIYE